MASPISIITAQAPSQKCGLEGGGGFHCLRHSNGGAKGAHTGGVQGGGIPLPVGCGLSSVQFITLAAVDAGIVQ